MIRVWLDGVDVTYWVVTKDLPEWLETSVKGAGWFEWRVSSFDFRLHDSAPVTPVVGMACVVSTKRFTLSGQIGKLEDVSTHVPRITVDPPALALKEVMAGSQEFGEDGRLRWVFDLGRFGGPLSTVAMHLLSTYNEERPTNYPALEWSVQVLGDPENPVQGLGPHELTPPQEGLLGYLSNGATSTLPIPYYDRDAPQLKYHGDLIPRMYPEWDYAPYNERLNALCIARRYYDGRLVISVQRRFETPSRWLVQYWALPENGLPENGIAEALFTEELEGIEAYSQWNSYIGCSTELPMESERVPDSIALGWVKRQVGGEVTDYEIIGFHDAPQGTWAFVRSFRAAANSTPPLAASVFATWWSDPLVQIIKGRWANKSMADLLQVFALVTGHMLKFEGSTVVFVPRADGEISVADPDPRFALKPVENSVETVSPPEVSVETQDPDADADDRFVLTTAPVMWWP